MPTKRESNNQSHLYISDEKRRLVNSLESARENTEVAPNLQMPSSTDTGNHEQELRNTDENTLIREELRIAKGTCALLEEEVKDLEKRAIAAIAEAGSLRRKLDQARGGKVTEERPEVTLHSDLAIQRTALNKQLAEADDIKNMLTMALCESESEISRMVKSLEVTIRKLQAV